MTTDELHAIQAIFHQELVSLRAEFQQDMSSLRKDVVTLMDTQFMTQFKLLAEGQEAILRKMPSEDDMDIIDGRLQEHDSEIKMLRQDVTELKRAQ